MSILAVAYERKYSTTPSSQLRDDIPSRQRATPTTRLVIIVAAEELPAATVLVTVAVAVDAPLRTRIRLQFLPEDARAPAHAPHLCTQRNDFEMNAFSVQRKRREYPRRDRGQIFADGKRLPFGRAKPKL